MNTVPVIVRTAGYIDAHNGRIYLPTERTVMIERVGNVWAKRPSIFARIIARFTR